MNLPVSIALFATAAFALVAILMVNGHMGAGCVSLGADNAHGAVICSVGFGR